MTPRPRRPIPPRRGSTAAHGRSATPYRDYGARDETDYYDSPYAAQAGYYDAAGGGVQPYRTADDHDPDYDDDGYERRRRGRLVTPMRLLLALAFVGSGLASLYGLFVVRSLPITISSLAVLGVSSGLLGLICGASSIRSAREGRAGRATLGALLGGVLLIGASGSLAAALVLALLVGPT